MGKQPNRHQSFIKRGRKPRHHRRVRRRGLRYEALESRSLLAAGIDVGSAVEGRIWQDNNSDGTRQTGEPGLTGIRVYVDANKDGVFNPGEVSTFTRPDDPATLEVDEAGQYRIDGVSSDQHLIRYALPAGHEQTYPAEPQLGFDGSYDANFIYRGFWHHPLTDLRLSETGRYLVFSTDVPMTSSDSNDRRDVYLVDRLTDEIDLISVNSAGESGNKDHFEPDVSSDGRFVIFRSDSTNLDPNDNLSHFDIYLRDRQANTTSLVSANVHGGDAGYNSRDGLISPDGKRVLFLSSAPDLISGDTNDRFDTFVRHLDTGVTERISLTEIGGEILDGPSWGGDMSASGRYVIFESRADDVSALESNGTNDIFWRDLLTGALGVASLANDGSASNGTSSKSSISDNGRWVAFDSSASNLTSDPHPGADQQYNVYLKDMLTGELRRLSIPLIDDDLGNSRRPEISGDGRWIAFESLAALVPEDTNQGSDIYVYDRFGDAVYLVSKTADGHVGNGPSDNAVISADGSTLAFTTQASNLGGEPGSVVIVDLAVVGDAIDVSVGASVTDINFGVRGNAPPEVEKISRVGTGVTAADTVAFDVRFSEPVEGVDLSDFVVSGNGIQGAEVVSVVGSERSYRVVVATGEGDGTISLQLADDNSIVDRQGVPLGGTQTGDGSYLSDVIHTIDRQPPLVEAVRRLDVSPTTARLVRFEVKFSEAVTGVDTSDFLAFTSGLAGTLVQSVSGGGMLYIVTVDVGDGGGSLRLDVLDDDTITDVAGKPLAGSFTNGESYTIEENLPPTAVSLTPSFVNENLPAGATVGVLTAVDPNVSDTFTFQLVAGEGSADNEAFEVLGGSLVTTRSLDYEQQSMMAVRVRATDAGGLSVEQPLSIQVADLNEGLLYDVNADGVVSARDALLIINFLIRDLEPSPQTLLRYDISRDGDITARDALLVINFLIRNAESERQPSMSQTNDPPAHLRRAPISNPAPLRHDLVDDGLTAMAFETVEKKVVARSE